MWMSKSVIAVMKDGDFGNYMCLVHLCVGVHPSMLTIPTAVITSVVVTHHKYVYVTFCCAVFCYCLTPLQRSSWSGTRAHTVQ